MIFGRSVSVIVVALAVSMAAQFGHAGFRSNAVGVVAYPPTGVDTDGDGTDDANDTDIDGDGLVNSIPLPLPTDADACPYLSDCDFDGLADADDGAPQNPDLDGDGVLDGADPDIDGDGIANAADSNSFDSSIGGDTDGDGYDDAREVADGTDPNVDQTVLDTDGDGTNDHAEILAGTDPNVNELTAIAQFASTPFTVDCTTTPGTCVVTGTVPTNATSVTVNGAQTGTSATASQVATISGGQFTATFTGLDHTASWDFTATASGGTGVTDVVSSAVAMTPTQLPALADSEFRLATNAAGNYTHLTGWPSTDSNRDYDVVSMSPASSTMTFVANDGSTLELEKVSGSGSVSGATWTGTAWGWGSPYATLRARKLNSSGDPITGWSSNFTLRRAAALTENVTIPTARLLDAANYSSGVVTLPGVNFNRRDNQGNTTSSSDVSNNNVTYYSDTPSVCTVSGNQLTASGAGDCTLRATYAAVGTNSPGDGDPVTFTMPAVQVQAGLVLDTSGISFVNNRATLVATGGTGSGAISYEITPSQEHRDVPNQNDANSICRVDNGNTLVGLGIGPCKIKVTRAGEGPYADRSDTFTLNITTSMITRDCVADMTRNDGICPAGYELAYVNELRACSGETNFSNADFFYWTANRDSNGNYDLATTDRLKVLYVKYNGRSGPSSPWEVRTHSRNLGGSGHRTLKSAADAHRSGMTAAVCRDGRYQANCAYQRWARPGQSEVWPLSDANRNAWMGDGWKDVVQSSASSASAATRSLATGRTSMKAVGCVRPIQ